MGKKIAVLITDEFEDSEFTSPAEAFRKAGHEVITIEKEAGKTVKGHKGEASVTIDETIDNVSPSDFDALLLPGGHSPDSLRGDERFVTFTRDFVSTGKPVFAICHGPQLLISADVIRGLGMLPESCAVVYETVVERVSEPDSTPVPEPTPAPASEPCAQIVQDVDDFLVAFHASSLCRIARAHLTLQVILQTDFANQIEFGFQPVDMAFFICEDGD